MREESQAKKILRYMQEHPSGITPLEALTNFGCMRLAARIADIRREGYDIDAEMVNEGGKSYCRYTLA